MMSWVSTMINILAMEEVSQTLLFHSSISIFNQIFETKLVVQSMVKSQSMNTVIDEFTYKFSVYLFVCFVMLFYVHIIYTHVPVNGWNSKLYKLDK